jgi:uncharacterized protein
MSQAAKAQEPSMEEILASIRRIIADDDATKASAPPPAPPKPAPAPAPAPPKAAAPPPPPPPPAPPAAPAKASNNQDDIDAMLAELDAMPAQKQQKAPEPEPEPDEDDDKGADNDILELTEAMAAPTPGSGFRTIDGKPDVVFNEPPPEKPAPPRAAPGSMVDMARRQFEHELGGPALMSANTTAAVDSAFNTLAHTVLSENARTLEDLVKEMLRPMLKTWLDDNLPAMVERMVRGEIERVSRGRNK